MVVRDVCTRWNYTHAMIRRGLLLKEAIDKWTFEVPALRGFVLTPNAWEYLEKLADLLEVCNFNFHLKIVTLNYFLRYTSPLQK
ncbi:hypothetical protein BDQ17DRAFT_1235806 [Cyathus striatus]|nr:hypothetical protein BDQ17DRAFT_1235806 [Cyathus striatus]